MQLTIDLSNPHDCEMAQAIIEIVSQSTLEDAGQQRLDIGTKPAKPQKAKPAKAAPPVQEVTTPPPELTIDQLRESMAGLVSQLTDPTRVPNEVFPNFGVNKLSELQPEQYQGVLDATKALVASQ